ncbi:MAG: glutamate synthase subunit beta [Oscillospiraceae bacterium]|nr:glutamate synthase subunit beta [Oscillospiraceae bacterium]
MFLRDNTVFVPVDDPNLAEERTANGQLDMERRLSTFDEVEFTYTEEEALAEAGRCLGCPTHWCSKACPAGVPVTEFIARVRAKDYEGAYQLIRTASTLPEMCSRVCPQERQCQSNCTRGVRTQSVGIGRLERFVAEQHYKSGKGEASALSTGKRVAVVGSGPSGLSAAQRLAGMGHEVTVYEASDRPGGLLEYGIPNMKLEKGVVNRKVEAMKAQGVQFRTGVTVGEAEAKSLTADYDAVVLCGGTGNARTLKLEGAEGVQGIYPAVEFLTANTKALLDGGEPISAKGKHVVIVGGGDTGSDCVGTSIRHGCASVTQIEMLPEHPGRPLISSPRPQKAPEAKTDHSQEECKSVFGRDPHVYQTTVKAVQADGSGRIQAVVTVDLEAGYDKERRLVMREIPGTERTLPCQLLIIAAGFLGPKPELAQAFGVETTGRGTIAGYATNVKKVFACGDCRTGQSLVVKAMVDGRDCADAVAKFLGK